MHVKMSLYREDGPAQDIVVTVEPTATVRDIAARIAAADPQRSFDERRSYTLQTASPIDPQWRLLPPDAVIGDEWLASGQSVALVDEADAAELLPSLHGGAAAVVTILSGPQTGRSITLGRGSHTLGRDPGCDVVLSDPYLSKRHLRLDIGQTVEVVDLGSANGIEIDGELVSRARVNDTLVVLAGGTELHIEVETREASRSLDQAGPVEFNRSPRVEERYIGRTFSVPEIPREPEDQPFPLLAMIAPILLGGAMFAITGRPITLLFIAMTPIMMVGGYLTNRRRDKRKLARQIARFDVGLAELGDRLEAEKQVEQRARVAEIPSSAELVGEAAQLGPLLWTRRPEHWSFLSLRLGSAAMPSRNTVDDEQRGDLMFEFQERLDAVIDEHRLVDAVPIVVELSESGAIGIAGDKDAAAGVLAAVLVQLTGLHSPAELVLTAALTPEWSAELDWLKWLPHASSPHSPLPGNQLAASEPAVAVLMDDLEGLIVERERAATRAREAARGAMSSERSALQAGANVGTATAIADGYTAPVPAVVVLIADHAMRDRARLVDLSERGADVGVFPVWIAAEGSRLPAVCRAFADLGGRSPGAPDSIRIGLVRLGEHITTPHLDRVTRAEAVGYARSLSRVVDANVPVDDVSDIPTTVSLVGLIDPDLLSKPDAVIERWWANESIIDRSRPTSSTRRRAGRLRATIGQSTHGVMHLDLRTQGPHALVGGTTGSGKSEFLQAWVLGMAAEYAPDRVTFLFVDYKGGSAFAECVKLPHAVGLVTDLTPHLVRRALTSLRAELHHREDLLHRKGAKDLLELEKRGDPDTPPALVLIIDEFAALVGEVPEFVDGVVDIAQRGRSLGIHLIMATQRPAGVIRDNLRANTNLRIALRMADESDSLDVVGEKDAGRFDPSIPGRAIAKTGPGRLEQFQSGYAGGWSTGAAQAPHVDVADMPFGIGALWSAPGDDETPEEREDLGPTDQKRMVDTMTEAARRARIPAPRRPWLDELPVAIDLNDLRRRRDDRLPLGVSDLPERQAQEVVAFQPDVDGHMAIFGTGGSGKSVALRTLAAAAALATESAVSVYAMDFGAGALRAIEELPGVGAVITGEDDERIVRLLRMLRGELDRRTRDFADARATSIVDYRALPGHGSEPRILLLIDNFPAFRENWEIPAGRSDWYRVFQDVMALGRPLGIHVVLTTDRFASLPSAIASGMQRRVVLRLADDTGYASLDVPTDVLTEDSPPGRAFVGGRETQLAVLGGSPLAADQTAAITALAERLRREGAAEAAGIPALPAVVHLDTLPTGEGAELVIGLAEDTLEPASVPPAGAFVIAGPPGSGRSNALAVFADRAFALPGHAAYFIGPRRSALASDPRFAATASTPEDVAELAKALREIVADPASELRCVVLIESIGDFLQTPADAPLVEMVRQFKREEHFVVAEAESSSWVSSWPLFGEFKNARRGLLLQPDQTDGDVILKTSLTRAKRADFPEGRGVVVAGGKTRRVQVALAPAPIRVPA